LFIYWALFLVLATGALLNSHNRIGRTRWLMLAVAAAPTALMIGLRWKIGPDWPAYASIYQYSGLLSLNEALGRDDPAFKILCLSLRQLHQPFWVLNAICGLVFVGGLAAFCQRQPNPWLAYLVAFPYLVIVVAMSGDRQSVALGLFFFGLNAFERGHLYRFALFTMAAALFHGSALVMLPLCLLSYTKSPWQRTLLLLLVLAVAIYFFQETFGVYARRYSLEKIQSAGVTYRLAMNSLSAILFLVFRQRLGLDDRQTKLWRNVSFCTLGLIPLLAYVPSSTAIDRFLLYLFPLQFVVLNRLPTALTQQRRISGLLTLLVIAYAGLVQMTFLSFGSYAKYYVPYQSILNR
jgi:hypothetical protein